MKAQEELLYGIHPVLEILRSRRPVSQIYMALHRGSQEIEAIYTLAREQRIPIRNVPPETIQNMAGTPKHQGVLAMVARRLDYDLDALLAVSAERGEAPFFLVIDSVEDPRNLGALLRTAESAGVHGAFLPKRRAAGLSPLVSKTSAGATAYLPIAQVTNLSQVLQRLQREAVQIVGLDAQSPLSYWECDFREAVALVVGGEGAGMRAKIQERCDVVVSLPMYGQIESLNVSVAAGIVVYEVLRQRRR